MAAYKSRVIDNIICDKVSGELDASLASEWVDKLEEHEAHSKMTLHRFHDVRDINAVNLSFDNLWSVAQRRLYAYKSGHETLAAFWVSTPLNYGVARMYQSLTAGTPFKIEVFYNLNEVADFLGIEQAKLEAVGF
ncbi:MAG: hypothetical protein OEY78_04900 [Gammaproteobacteria bacterium]|nr:hypothetical protein [Gammaproteobacteria bacterium]